MKTAFDTLFSKPTADNGFNQPADKLARRYPTKVLAAAEPKVDDSTLQLPNNGTRATWSRWSTTGRRRIVTAPARSRSTSATAMLIAAITSHQHRPRGAARRGSAW
jgi:hypothetical protein